MTRSSLVFPILLASSACAVPAAVAAQGLPAWPIKEICAKEPAQCLEFEARARQAVSGGWGVLPEDYRKACLAELTSPLDRSWRLLSQCIELTVLKGLDKEAIATAATPAEPVPPPPPRLPPVPEAASAPPPPDAASAPPPPINPPTAPPKTE